MSREGPWSVSAARKASSPSQEQSKPGRCRPAGWRRQHRKPLPPECRPCGPGLVDLSDQGCAPNRRIHPVTTPWHPPGDLPGPAGCGSLEARGSVYGRTAEPTIGPRHDSREAIPSARGRHWSTVTSGGDPPDLDGRTSFWAPAWGPTCCATGRGGSPSVRPLRSVPLVGRRHRSGKGPYGAAAQENHAWTRWRVRSRDG
jgi:hypothetical protein